MIRFLTLVGLAMSGCTVQQTLVDGVVVEQKVGFGLIATPRCGVDAEQLRSKSYGLALGPERLGFGYFESDMLCLPPEECHLIIRVEDFAQIEFLKDLVGDIENICLSRY